MIFRKTHKGCAWLYTAFLQSQCIYNTFIFHFHSLISQCRTKQFSFLFCIPFMQVFWLLSVCTFVHGKLWILLVILLLQVHFGINFFFPKQLVPSCLKIVTKMSHFAHIDKRIPRLTILSPYKHCHSNHVHSLWEIHSFLPLWFFHTIRIYGCITH